MENFEQQQITGLTVVGEQDGDPERVLKAKLSEALEQFPAVKKAYLARVRYSESGPVEVALCLYGAPESAEIVDACSKTFASLFRPDLSLDILFVDAEQDSQLAGKCKGFLDR